MDALRIRRTVATLVLVGALIAIPAIAVAAPGDGTVASTRTESVSGMEIAGEMVKSLSRVALGSEGATVTLDVDGAPHEVGLDLAAVAPDLEGGRGSGLAGLALISAMAAGVLKLAAIMVRVLG